MIKPISLFFLVRILISLTMSCKIDDTIILSDRITCNSVRFTYDLFQLNVIPNRTTIIRLKHKIKDNVGFIREIGFCSGATPWGTKRLFRWYSDATILTAAAGDDWDKRRDKAVSWSEVVQVRRRKRMQNKECADERDHELWRHRRQIYWLCCRLLFSAYSLHGQRLTVTGCYGYWEQATSLPNKLFQFQFLT